MCQWRTQVACRAGTGLEIGDIPDPNSFRAKRGCKCFWDAPQSEWRVIKCPRALYDALSCEGVRSIGILSTARACDPCLIRMINERKQNEEEEVNRLIAAHPGALIEAENSAMAAAKANSDSVPDYQKKVRTASNRSVKSRLSSSRHSFGVASRESSRSRSVSRSGSRRGSWQRLQDKFVDLGHRFAGWSSDEIKQERERRASEQAGETPERPKAPSPIPGIRPAVAIVTDPNSIFGAPPPSFLNRERARMAREFPLRAQDEENSSTRIWVDKKSGAREDRRQDF